MKKIISRVFMIAGVALILWAGILYLARINPYRLSFQNPSFLISNKPFSSSNQLPQNIVISRVGINLPIFPAHVTNNSWETTIQGASYLASSPLPGLHGNSIIYGHNWTSLFGKLVNVKPGDTVTVSYSKTEKKQFKILYTMVVTPDQTSILAPSSDSRITLYTCTGFLDSKRFVAVAELE